MPYIPTKPYQARYTKEFDVPVEEQDILEVVGSAMWEPTGFAPGHAAKTSMMLFGSIREFTLTAIYPYRVYQRGVIFDIDSDQTVYISDVDGIHGIYMDNGVLKTIANPTGLQAMAIITQYVAVATILYDATNNRGIIFEERHGCVMDKVTLGYLYASRGCQYYLGLGLNSILADQDGSSNTHAQFGMEAGVCLNEDLAHDSSAVLSTTGFRIFYRDGANWRWTTSLTGFAVMTTGTGRLAWDNAGTVTEVANNGFVNCHLFFSNEYAGGSGGRPVAFMGQAEYGNINAAREGASDEINQILSGLLPVQTMKSLGTVIFQTSDSYTNSVKARIRSTGLGTDWIDFRMAPGSGGASPTSHASLTGLINNDHSFYLDPRVEPMFLAYPNAVITNITGDGTSYVIKYNSTSFDVNSNFSTSTGLFTAPVDGTYLFMANVTMDNISTVNHTTYYMSLNAQGGSFLCQSGGSAEAGSGTRISRSLNCIVYLTAGQTCGVVVNMGGTSKTVDIAASAVPGTVRNSFAGYRIG